MLAGLNIYVLNSAPTCAQGTTIKLAWRLNRSQCDPIRPSSARVAASASARHNRIDCCIAQEKRSVRQIIQRVAGIGVARRFSLLPQDRSASRMYKSTPGVETLPPQTGVYVPRRLGPMNGFVTVPLLASPRSVSPALGSDPPSRSSDWSAPSWPGGRTNGPNRTATWTGNNRHLPVK